MLNLQPAQTNHAQQWLALVNKDRAWLESWMPYLQEIRTEEEAKEYIHSNARLNFYLGEQVYELWQKEALVGLLTLHSGKLGERSVEIGYWLGKDYIGQGLTAAACQLIFSKVFATTGIQSIQIKCEERNLASQAVAQKLGLALVQTKEGILTYTQAKAQWMQTGYEEDDLLHFLDDEFFL